MTKRTRRNHAPAFKARVALAALEGDKTLSELSDQFGVHPNQIQQWKRQLEGDAMAVFESGSKREPMVSGPDVKELHAKIGQLTMERDFLVEKLEPWIGPVARK